MCHSRAGLLLELDRQTRGGQGRAQAPLPPSDVSPSSVKVMPFANLMSLLGPSVDSVAVLRGIQKVAMLVQGNWVVKR